MDLQKMLDSLIPMLGQAGVDALSEEIQDLAANQEDGWKKAAFALLNDAVTAHGMDGIEMARQAISDLFEKKMPEIDWASPRTASDVVAQFQNMEADAQSAANDFFTRLGMTMSKVLVALIKGLVTNGLKGS